MRKYIIEAVTFYPRMIKTRKLLVLHIIRGVYHTFIIDIKLIFLIKCILYNGPYIYVTLHADTVKYKKLNMCVIE